ncbi:phospholipase D-like domain-containing protein [Microbulbifer sp. JMSA004]|uniref:phospholipase D-like domain-containing protein n=1 Tax=Microbulbifer sp. JMSA004 TaxID=3243370 RepID=UPI004039F3CB
MAQGRTMQTISNIENNHLLKLQELFALKSNRIVIISPYLESDIPSLLSEFDFSHTGQIDLITTFKPSDKEQLTKPEKLKAFFEFFQENYPTIKIKLHVDNSLHAKVYIRVGPERPEMIITSANFTKNGLIYNNEWGYSVTNKKEVQSLLEAIFSNIEYTDITYHQIKKAASFSEQYSSSNPEWIESPQVTSDILSVIYSSEDKSNKNPKYFLKPIGTSESPVTLEEQRDFSDLHQNLHFSKKKPKGVRKGDVVITTAVGAGSILAYFKVTGGLEHVTEHEISLEGWKERWPWYMEGKNQSIKFSSEWWVHNLRRQEILDEFNQTHTEIPVTVAGGFSLGTLNMGNDKVQITEEFALFIIDKIKTVQSSINRVAGSF